MRTTRDGFAPGSATKNGSALIQAHTPGFSNVQRTVDGFTAQIDDFGTQASSTRWYLSIL